MKTFVQIAPQQYRECKDNICSTTFTNNEHFTVAHERHRTHTVTYSTYLLRCGMHLPLTGPARDSRLDGFFCRWEDQEPKIRLVSRLRAKRNRMMLGGITVTLLLSIAHALVLDKAKDDNS